MGAGIAYVSAKAGMQVVLKDISLEAAEKGKAYSQTIVDKAVARGRLTQEKADALLALIKPTADYADLEGCDFVVEAVFESVKLKHEVFAEVEKVVRPDALLGSNTSTLPITILADGVKRSEDFIGIHFFSPVDKMPLVEIIAGKDTSDEAIARVIDYTKAIKKTPIVVGDSRGFFTSRVIGTFVNEGIAMLAEGVSPVSIERATVQAGFPAPVLQLSDAQPRADGQDPQRVEGRSRGGRPGLGRQRCRGYHRHDDRDRPSESTQGCRLLRVRRWQAHRPLAGSGRAVPGGSRAAGVRGPQGASDVHHEPRDDQVPRRGAAVGARCEHRLDLRDRLPGPAGRCDPVRQRLRGRGRLDRRRGVPGSHAGAGREVR
ncbi:3-hydroxyacyl-CoA dehydrogenase family protein [Aeromicrobium sp. UC242_57]|uniref:3-hydroxyacyl-CoA dehydrogenase family protein n=1 Tax=Aeromicrobium sp. UC242_57 TaxID=3374624 RepID=UPI003787907F